MNRQRPSPWLLLIAATFLGYWSLLVYCEIRHPEPLGVLAEFDEGRMMLVDVVAGSVAARAGLQPGDQLAASGGQPIHSRLDWMAIEASSGPRQPLSLAVDRHGTHVDVTIALEQLRWADLFATDQLVLRAVRLVQLVSIALAIFLVVRRPDDTMARLGAWLLAAIGVFSLVLPYGLGAVWRQLPVLPGAFLWIPFISSLAVAPIGFTFFAMFPRAAFRSRAVWTAVWAPVVVWLVWHVYYGYHLVYVPTRVTGVPDWSVAITLASAAYIVGGLVVLVANYQRLDAVNERRRVRVIVFGALVGGTSGVLVAIMHWLERSADLTRSFVASPLAMIGTLLFLALPLSFVYAIPRYRLFDLAVIVRQGVQYAFARRVLLSVVPALGILLSVDLFVHRQRPLVELLRTHGWIYLVLAAVTTVAHWKRRDWLEYLDRRFFRERYNAHQLLRQVAEDIRRAGSFARVAPRVVAQIETALHPQFVALLVRQPDEAEYRVLASAPPEHIQAPLPADNTIVALLRVLGKPLDVSLSESGWLARRLPSRETELLRETGIELIVPIALDQTRPEALLVLGTKRSEEPYSGEDDDLLVVLAGSLALLLEKTTVAGDRTTDEFDECPACGTCYEKGPSTCAQEGARLAPSHLPRTLAGRYRLERRLGRGGMGTVYVALDTALERRVAAKVIREDLATSRNAADRFQREARIVAGFTHPNVVTVHDFGVMAGTHAFLIMELLDGMTLREELSRNTRVPPMRALEILRGVTAAVEAAHLRQFVHRDLKPENIFLVRANSVEIAKVVDFGIAKALTTADGLQGTSDTGLGAALGTLAYMAPEQLRGEAVGPAWDIWALGVVAYEMLTGAHPFSAQPGGAWPDPMPAFHADAVTARLSGAPPAWRSFFLRALAIEPGRRPDTARCFFAELEQAIRS